MPVPSRGSLLPGGWLLHALALAVPVLLLAPMLVFGERYFTDWENSLFIVDRQADAIRQTGFASYFIHTYETGLFYPIGIFYGGTLYAMSGYLAVAFSSSWLAYVFMWGVGFAMAYGGMWWLARQVGIQDRLAHLPALVVVTSAYAITNAYARGSWPEFMATSSIPLAVAGSVAVARASHVRARDWALLYAPLVILAGSHNITLLWATLLSAIFVVAVVAASGRSQRLPGLRRSALIAWAVVAALMTNAWFLLPGLLWASNTVAFIGAAAHVDSGIGEPFNKPEVFLFPGRLTPSESTTPDLYVQAPALILAWALVVTAVLFASSTREYRSLWIATVVVLTLLFVLILWAGVWASLPDALRVIQFQYRLQSYVTLCAAGLVILALLALKRVRRSSAPLFLAVLIAGGGAGLALDQAWSAERYGGTDEVLESPSHLPPRWYAPFDFRQPASTPLATPTTQIVFPPEQVQSGRLALDGLEPGIYATNLVHSEAIRGFGGARVLGGDRDALVVLEVPPAPPVRGNTGVEQASPPAVLAGRILSVGGALTALATVAVLAIRRRRPRASPESPSGPPTQATVL